MMDNDTAKIRALNDSARSSTFLGCRVMITSGIRALDDIAGVMQRVAEYDAFTKDNDPHGEHDFGSFKHGGEMVFWKLDYYDLSLTAGSDQPLHLKLESKNCPSRQPFIFFDRQHHDYRGIAFGSGWSR